MIKNHHQKYRNCNKYNLISFDFKIVKKTNYEINHFILIKKLFKCRLYYFTLPNSLASIITFLQIII